MRFSSRGGVSIGCGGLLLAVLILIGLAGWAASAIR